MSGLTCDPFAENLIRAVDALRAAEQQERQAWRDQAPFSQAAARATARVMAAQLALIAAAYVWREEQHGQTEQEPAG